MASPQENVSMAVFCDFENVALGVRDAKIDRFDIKPVLERLLLKGSIVVKKAYCDWDRYKAFKSSMHEASFELIEIPHVRQSGKNSADIRLVVDALDLCYTKSHVDTFVIVSGDSDFSPLVSKLRENAKKVIGVGVKNSTSDLLVANCDEFIFYDDLVREMTRVAGKRDGGAAAKRDNNDGGNSGSGNDERQPKPETEDRKSRAIAFAVETLDALVQERGDSGKIWASVLKSAIKRRRPDFNEARYGFRAFGNLLDEAQARGLLEVGRDEKSGAYVSRLAQPAGKSAGGAGAETAPAATAEDVAVQRGDRGDEVRGRRGKGRRDARGSGGASAAKKGTAAVEPVEAEVAPVQNDAGEPAVQAVSESEETWATAASAPAYEPVAEEPAVEPAAQPDEAPTQKRGSPRRARKTPARKTAAREASAAPPAAGAEAAPAPAPEEPQEPQEPATATDAPAKKKSKKKSPSRARAKPAATADEG
ncbi:NYN domain-containing protein [Paraburkholderia caballeronis]|uniref:NYN domain-containing protein n=1 Tax=Paraburkholderia caballeronis TaxID=416943 RepID=UPI001065F271|nr:NYN domain-containing protein [Paraburkholderia caballeronis]